VSDARADPDEFEVADPSEYKQKRRIRDILDAKNHVIETKREIRHGVLLGQLDEQTGNHALRDAVEDLIYEVEPVLKGHPKKLQYWGGLADEDGNPVREDGHGQLVVVREDEEYAFDDDPLWTGPHLGTMVLPDGDGYEFHGLGDVVQTPDPMVIEWEEETDDEYDGEETETKQEVVQIPQDVLMSAYRTTNAFLFEIGLDLEDSDDQLPHDKI
jgi:hypothetical protein